jgi:hypothetical protein
MVSVTLVRRVLAACVLGGAAVAAGAAPVVFTFANEFSGSGSTCAAATGCATLSVEQVGSGVEFILTGTMSGAEFVTGLYGNRDPFASSAMSGTIKTGSFTDPTLANRASGSPNDAAFKADGDGFFDWRMDFAQPVADRYNGVDVFQWTFANTLIADVIGAISVDGPAGKTGFTFALRAQGLGDGSGSGWFYSVDDLLDDDELPEPGSVALVGLALAALGMSRRRRR